VSIISIDVYHDRVLIEGHRVLRPNGVAVSVWTKFWDGVRKGSYDEGYARGYSDGERDAEDRHRGH
jgi:hypothetical protein